MQYDSLDHHSCVEQFSIDFVDLRIDRSGTVAEFQRCSKSLSKIREEIFAYFLLFPIGFSFFYNFVMHVFFGDMTARFIGWQNSPFQAEVGFASLGFAFVGFLAFRGSHGLRIGAVVGPAFFLLGAGVAHVRQIIVARNFAPGNAGVMLYMDFIIPLIGLALLRLEHPDARTGVLRESLVASESRSEV